MTLTNTFYDAVSSGKLRRVRIMMKDSLLNDPSFTEFNEMLNAARNMKELYDDHDGRVLNYEKSSWTDHYMNELMVQVVGNFSRDRIDLLKKVVRHNRSVAISSQGASRASEQFGAAYGSGLQKLGSGNQTTSTKQGAGGGQGNHSPWGYSYSNRSAKVACGAIAGAAVGGAIAAAASVAIVGGAVAGAVIGGVTVAIATNGEQLHE